MPTDQSAIAFERFDVAADEDRAPVAAPVCDLAELAAALARAEALVAAGADDSPDAAAALERIADIAFVLHEREVERSLCDALDAAMREIGEVNARNRASAQRAHEAAELLREVRRRLDAMMAAQAQPWGSAAVDSGERECADGFPAPSRLFDADVAQDGAFAETVAALADSLPAREGAASAHCQDHLPLEHGAAHEALTHSDVAAEADVAAEKIDITEAVGGARDDPEPREHEYVAAARAAVPSPDAAAVAGLASSAAAAAMPAVEAIDPDEDPGDLFEPMPGIEPASDVSAPPPLRAAAEQTAAAMGSVPQLPRDAEIMPTLAGSRPAANDPLAPIRALSEEELIALFS